jgi:AcrR family transcriptional regulator
MVNTFNEVKHEEQRLRILAQAQKLFAENGYSQTSMSDLAEACKLQKASLYHYFEGKEALLFGIMECHHEDESHRALLEKIKSSKTLEEKLYQLAKQHCEDMSRPENLNFLKILLVETSTNQKMKDYFLEFMKKQTEFLVKELVEPILGNKMKPVEMRRLLFQFLAALIHYTWQVRMVGPIHDMIGSEEAYIRLLAKTYGNLKEA